MVGPSPSHRGRWSNLVPFCVALIVIVEIASLGRLDMAEKASAVEHYWTTSFYFPSTTAGGGGGSDATATETPSLPIPLDADEEGDRNCEEWLEREDAVDYDRDFSKHPVIVSGVDQDWSSCSVGCKFGDAGDRVADAAFGLPQDPAVSSVLRSMESSHYYAENNIDLARRRGYKIIMTTSLSSDVPVGYFSWAEYDIMAPLHPKTEDALAAAFISNCGARNFRLQALEMLEKLDIKIDSYGSCHRNRDGKDVRTFIDGSFEAATDGSPVRGTGSSQVDKVETLKRYKFSLAFENSNEEDYVTEKFFQSLVAGTVPIVVGAPNIQDFAPSPGSILHIKELEDVASVAKTMRHLAENPDAFNQSVSWKFEGPSDSFKALVDMAAVHSSCRLCIHIATKIQEKEEKSPKFQNRPCKCTDGSETVYHLYVRERGRFKMENIYLRSSKLTMKELKSAVLEKFKSLNHEPVWKKERPESIRGGDDLKIHIIYPVGVTQRRALYNFMFSDDAELKKYIESNPCAKLEVIFV